ncbi:MAG: NAD(+) synthase [Microthrixaceae bacterium]|nr:NAD(+) synthase [Microthrixaceae bacterium]
MAHPFDSPYAHGFVRVAAATPKMHLAEPARNAASTVELLRRAHDEAVALVVFPELGLVGYSCGDLFHQEALLRASLDALEEVRVASRDLVPVAVVGLPLRVDSQLFNVAAILHRGEVVAVVPKSYLPNYREFYEKRHFSASRQAVTRTVRIGDRDIAFGTDLLVEVLDVADLVIGVEICEDLWVPVPPSSFAALAGATVLANPSGSNVTIAKADYRRELCRSHSARTMAAYVYSGCGVAESTTDLAWDGHALIAENGNLVAESERFGAGEALTVADVDLERLVADRIRMTSFADSIEDHAARLEFRRVGVRLDLPRRSIALRRDVARFPFVPADPQARNERCAEVYAVQRAGLATRLTATGLEHLVIGVSGGLDSTHALLVAVGVMDDLRLPRTNVLAYTMPGFATSEHTLTNARRLMAALGVSAHEIDIRPASERMLEDLGHPAADGDAHYDLTYENVQAGARTSLLFRLANQHHGLVVGTGDLSELALGWCTYGVGDHMSHYGVNASVPKTLIQYLVRWVAETGDLGPEAAEVLESVLDTEISPELIPAEGSGGGDGPDSGPHQLSEEIVGPYELQDFHLYYVLRFGYSPTKVAYLANQAWGARGRGEWPATIPEQDRHEYDLATILRWLRVFLHRFMQTSQFKRSALPDGPKVGSGGSLSPRGDWRAPSDASSAVWLAELDALDG